MAEEKQENEQDAQKSSQEQDIGLLQTDHFYYSLDNILHGIDNDRILATIREKYPEFNENVKESILKQVMVALLDDDDMIEYVLKHFDLTIQDLFMIIYKKFSFVFSPCYITKMHALLKKKKY